MLMTNPFKSYGYLRAKDVMKTGEFKYKNLSFCARQEDWIAIKEVIVEDEYECLGTLLSGINNPVVIDLGANIGTFALKTFSVKNDSHVYSIEAVHDTFEILSRNKSLNPDVHWNIFNNGIWDKNGPISIQRRGSSVSHRLIEEKGDERIEGITLSCFLTENNISHPDLIKMDIEGGEEAVIPNSLEVFEKTKFLVVELHSDRINIKPLLQLLRKIYKNCWQLNNRTSAKPLLIMTNENVNFPNYSEYQI